MEIPKVLSWTRELKLSNGHNSCENENSKTLNLSSKNSYNAGENDGNGKKFKLVLKTIYKKVFPKYQPNQGFPSLW